MIELFLVCAMSLPAIHFQQPAIVGYHMTKSEKERLEDWLRKNNPDADIFIHPNPQEDILINNHWERVPFTWRGNKIWIHKKPPQKKMRTSA